MTSDELRQQIELKIVEMIKNQMESGALQEERAQAISQHVLTTLQPGMSFEQLFKAVPKLDDTFPELSPIVLPILQDYEKNVNIKAMEQVRELIKQGQYDAAAKLGRMAISQEIKLTWEGTGAPDNTTSQANP